MKATAIAAASIAALAFFATTHAEEKRASPHADVTATLAGKKITVSDGRPYMKGRAIFGSLVPWGEVWRTGADEATTFTTEADLVIGGLKVAKGEYALFTIPTEKQWTLVLNKTAKQWASSTMPRRISARADDRQRRCQSSTTIAWYRPAKKVTLKLPGQDRGVRRCRPAQRGALYSRGEDLRSVALPCR
jgi:hypothetical protein